MKRFVPLILVETYLLFTLMLFLFGPLNFRIHNEFLFFVLMLSYHCAFLIGYILSNALYRLDSITNPVSFNSSGFYKILIFAVIASLITYQNVMLNTTLIPWDLFEQISRGIQSPAEVYVERLQNLSSGSASTSRILNVLSIFIMFFKFLFIYYCVYFWKDFDFIKKLIFVLYCAFFISPSIAGGINSILFYFFIFTSVSVFFVKFMRSELSFLRVLVVSLVVLLIPIGFFGYIMSLRGGGFEFFNRLSPIGDISINISTPELDSILGFYSYSFVWICSYLVQGYYGFSVALSESWIWTYGFGSSHFLQSQLFIVFGVDVSTLTFQSRISAIWDEKAMWHSFYAQIANDVSFVGVSIIMFIFGFLLSRVWCSIIYQKSFYGSALMPILVLFFIFLPANNQVFSFIDTISYFFAILILWLFEGKRIRYL